MLRMPAAQTVPWYQALKNMASPAIAPFPAAVYGSEFSASRFVNRTTMAYIPCDDGIRATAMFLKKFSDPPPSRAWKAMDRPMADPASPSDTPRPMKIFATRGPTSPASAAVWAKAGESSPTSRTAAAVPNIHRRLLLIKNPFRS